MTRVRLVTTTALLALFGAIGGASAQTITLQPSTSPTTGQPGVHTMGVTGGGFPSGTISPASVQVRLEPATTGAGPTATTPALAVTTLIGSTRRVSFRIPTGIAVTTPTAYRVSISGSTSTGTAFASSNTAGLTVNPPASIAAMSPASADRGETVTVTVTGSFTNFVQGSTTASFGPDVSVGGAASGAFGPVAVTSPTSAEATVVVGGDAGTGQRTITVRTGLQQASGTFEIRSLPVPTISSIVSPAPNAAGWHAGPVTITYTCTDATTCPAAETVTTDGGNQVITRTAVGPGGTAEATVTLHIDQIAPAVAITSPANNATFTASPAAVAGSITENGSGIATLTCNNVAAAVASGSFTCSVPLAAGSNTILVRAVDVAGNMGDASIVVRLEAGEDTTPPSISINSPEPGSTLFHGRPAVDITYSDPSGVNLASLTVSAGGTPLVVDCALSAAGGRCTPTSTLPDGPVALSVSLEDTKGNRATAGVSFTIDGAPVSIDITSPQDRLITRDATLAVTGSVGTGVTEVTINGEPAALAGSSFSVTVPLREGVNMIVAVATKSNGKTGTDSIDVTRDIIAPIVRIDSPRDGLVSSNASVPVTGLVNDIVNAGLNAIVTVNGATAAVGDGTFMVTSVPLVRGLNTIEARARDAAGNEATHKVNVTYEVPVGARLSIESGNGQAALVKQVLSQPLVAVIKDDLGNPIAGRVVRFEVTRNSGALRLNGGGAAERVLHVPTDGSGRATVLYTLGDTAGQGNNRVGVTATGVTGEIEFCASGLTAPPDKILMTAGDNQRGVVGHPLATPLEALVVDRDGNPVKDFTVTFAIAKGSGHLDGSPTIQRTTGVDGIARAVVTLGAEPGINNNVVTASYDGLTALPATFTASALVAGDPAQTKFRGVVLDNGHAAIPGARVFIEHTDVEAITDAEGQFLLEDVPVGKIHLIIDPSDSPRAETFPGLAFETVTIAGQVNVLGQPILIPAQDVDSESSKIVGGPEDVTLRMKGVAGLEMTVFANSVTCPDGSKQCRVTISQVHLDKVPMPPPSGTFFMPPAWTVQPAGTKFNPPARIQIPNDGMAPGRIIDIFQFDHALNMFINIGKGTTSADASVIVSDPGFGITAAGWGGCGQPQPPTTCAASPGPCEKCDTSTGQIVPDAAKAGQTCDDKNACTKETTCSAAGKCEGGKAVTNTTGSQADIDAWTAYLKKCGTSPTLEAICKDAGIGAIDAKVGRSQPNVVTDAFDTKEIDLDDLDSIDKLRCSWSGDSCQDIIHFLRERLTGDFATGHADGFADESKYRMEKGWKGEKLDCVFIDTNGDGVDDLKCIYDDDGDGVTDRTETLEIGADNNYTKVVCKP